MVTITCNYLKTIQKQKFENSYKTSAGGITLAASRVGGLEMQRLHLQRAQVETGTTYILAMASYGPLYFLCGCLKFKLSIGYTMLQKFTKPLLRCKIQKLKDCIRNTTAVCNPRQNSV